MASRRSSNRQHYEVDPFTDLLFNVLMGFTMLLFMMLINLNPPSKKTGVVDTKAEFIVTTTWPDGSEDDIDTWVEGGDGEVVWFRHPDAGLMHLDRDDRGISNDTITVNGQKIINPLNQEVVTLRGKTPGEYTVNINNYKSTSKGPVPVQVNVVKVNPVLRVIYYDTIMLTRQGEEKTAVRFTVTPDGNVVNVNTLQKSLVKSRD
ncbi:hypothetical protein [uncultured Nevskia sp.]|uniref:hypothetical protein n=1 Tax=uncultured Nevskia sp. TaxID=228950 RepID=UPI0025DA05E0|nr:hypothetical protein [uncultured Nevskia sp.]